MAYEQYEVTCPASCADAAAAIPVFKFDECAPEINGGEIQKIYLAPIGQPFTDVESASEWTTRLAAAANAATKLTVLHVIADKPKPTGQTKEVSLGRKITLGKDHVVNATVDETTIENHKAFSQISQCGGRFLMWYETSGGLVFGGNKGIKVSIDADMIVPRSKGDSITWDLVLSWNTRETEQRTVSPIA
jgi:hypothetical protein